MRRRIGLVVAALLGCSYGRQFSYEDTKKLAPGISKRADAERIFGPPASVTSSSDGTMICSWSYTSVGFYGSNPGTKVLLITFRPDGTYDRASETASGSQLKAEPAAAR